MPILVFIILVVLIAQLGFWKTFAAILGGAAMIALFVILAILFLALARHAGHSAHARMIGLSDWSRRRAGHSCAQEGRCGTCHRDAGELTGGLQANACSMRSRPLKRSGY